MSFQIALAAAAEALAAAGFDTENPLDAGAQIGRNATLRLRALATTCGATGAQADAMRPVDLVALWNVARVNENGARLLLVRMTRAATAPVAGQIPAPVAGQPAPVDTAAIAAAAAALVLDDMRPAMDAKLMDMADEIDRLKSGGPRLVTVALATPANPSPAPSAPMLAHSLFPRVLRAVASGRRSPMLVGPAGSGKSKLAEQVAGALNLPFFEAAKVTSEHQLLGFINATGQVVRTAFREAWEHGGVFFFDEVDASNPSALTAFNGALANTICPFPDGNVTRHKDFRAIAAANTIGTGATRQYAGRNALDGATRDRFYFMQMDYDEALEMALAPVKSWARLVQEIRAAAVALGWQMIISPRASIGGGHGLLEGDTVEEALDATALKDLDPEQARKLWARVCLPDYERDIAREIEAASNPILSAVAA